MLFCYFDVSRRRVFEDLAILFKSRARDTVITVNNVSAISHNLCIFNSLYSPSPKHLSPPIPQPSPFPPSMLRILNEDKMMINICWSLHSFSAWWDEKGLSGVSVIIGSYVCGIDLVVGTSRETQGVQALKMDKDLC